MDFSDALYYAKRGDKIYRLGWNGKNQHVAVQEPDENSEMGYRYMYLKTVEDKCIPWTVSQADIFAEDWKVRELNNHATTYVVYKKTQID